MMKFKRAIAASVSITAFTASAAVPLVFAASESHNTLDARSDQASSAVKDAWLDGKLEATLLFNEHLNAFDIDTDVRNGVAYLTGAVDSDIDRDLAGEIAESVKGVDRVENDLMVDKAKAKEQHTGEAAKERDSFRQSVVDATLTSRVKSQLLLNNNTGGLDIDVDSSGGKVTLSGQVDSKQEGDLAVEIARNTEGTESVEDNLRVSGN